jgi:hypothetical protein
MMDRARINLIVDSAMMLSMMPLAGIGFLLKFVLLPGKERAAVYGSGVDLYVWGLGRHDWGALHLYLGYLLLALLLAHILLHLAWIGAVVKKMIVNTKVTSATVIAFFALCLMLLVFPFLIAPEVRYSQSGIYSLKDDNTHSDGREALAGGEQRSRDMQKRRGRQGTR